MGNLARPGGNITGVCPHPGLDIWGKRLEILLEAVSASKVGFLTGSAGLTGVGLSTTGEMAIYQGSKFELLLNLKAAKALGITLPATLLACIDEVIE